MNVYFKCSCLIVGIIILSGGCSKKSLPIITARTTEPFTKEEEKSSITPDLAAGKSIFMSNCGKCHDLPLAEQFTAQRWEGILGSMIPQAKLNQEQRVHVSAYIKANALK